jgi:hypothetical protein
VPIHFNGRILDHSNNPVHCFIVYVVVLLCCRVRFAHATTTLRTKLKAVHAAGKEVAKEVHSQVASMSLDFEALSKQVVQAVGQLTTQKDEAVNQYRREQRSRQKGKKKWTPGVQVVKVVKGVNTVRCTDTPRFLSVL